MDCTARVCATFVVRRYLAQLRQALPYVPPIDRTKLIALHSARDHFGLVKFIKRLMNIEAITFQVFWVPDGAAKEHKDAAAWVELPPDMPPYGSKKFNETTIKMFFRKSFLNQAYDQAAFAIAHEFSHVILESIRHPLRGCEKAVDMTAMLLGFGQVYATACRKQRQVGEYIETWTSGYLTFDEAAQVNQLLAEQSRQGRCPAPQPDASALLRKAKLPLLAATVAILIAIFPVYKIVAIQGELHATQVAFEKRLPLRINGIMSLVSIETGWTNLTLVYRLETLRRNVAMDALKIDETRRLCGTAFSPYVQEYRDNSGELIGQFQIQSCP